MFIYSCDTKNLIYVTDVIGLITGYQKVHFLKKIYIYLKEHLENQNIYNFIHQEDFYKLDKNYIQFSDQIDTTCELSENIELTFTNGWSI